MKKTLFPQQWSEERRARRRLHERKPHLVSFLLPEVRTLADMTPEERVAIARQLGAPLSAYDANGEPSS